MEKLGTIYNANIVRITLNVLKSSVPLASPVIDMKNEAVFFLFGGLKC